MGHISPILKILKLENFRNHRQFELDLDQITVLVGRNGAGKSNVLEAIVFLSFCRSFRQDAKKNLINHQADYARVQGDELEVVLTRQPQFVVKTLAKGTPRRLADFVGLLPAVVLSPEMMVIVTGSPSERRRFLDIMISQVDREYLRALVDYNKIKLQRNRVLERLLFNQGEAGELAYWDKELISNGNLIVGKRRQSVEYLNGVLSGLYQEISEDEKVVLKVDYVNNFSDLKSDLAANQSREIAAKRTIIGPHRDELIFILDSTNMANFASRGEIKSAILALKVAELKYVEQKRLERKDQFERVRPILLLDDIFSEFDAARRKHLVDLINDYQTVITAADKNLIDKRLLERAKTVELK